MRTVYVHVNAAGAWALTKCACCREVHRYVLQEAANRALSCKSCGRPLDIRRAIRAEATADVAASGPPQQGMGAAVRRTGGRPDAQEPAQP